MGFLFVAISLVLVSFLVLWIVQPLVVWMVIWSSVMWIYVVVVWVRFFVLSGIFLMMKEFLRLVVVVVFSVSLLMTV
jgi:hypothetical protein